MKEMEMRKCERYDKDRIALTVPMPREYYLKRIIAIALSVAFFALSVIVCSTGIWWLTQASEGGGYQGGDAVGGGGEETEGDNKAEIPEETVEDNGDLEWYPSEGEDGENEEIKNPSDGTHIENTTEVEKKDEPIKADLSLAERGDTYIINYSKLSPDVAGILEMGFSGGRYAYTEEPVVLVLHTHTSEGYYDMDRAVPTHILTRGVVAAGERLVRKLTGGGVPAVHCTVIHDGGEENPYRLAADTVKTMLEIYPSIEYVIDLHRLDEAGENGESVKTVSATGSAQVRITVSSGGIMQRDTLALALALRRELNSDGKRACMPVVLTDSEYNAGLVPYYLKIDLGSSGNDSSEAMEACDLLAEAIIEILKK